MKRPQAAAATRGARAAAHAPSPRCRLQGLPALSEGCANFAEAAQRIAAARAQNRQLLQQHGCAARRCGLPRCTGARVPDSFSRACRLPRAPARTLLELLELGALLETCVRNGSYDEALDLEAFCGKLAVAAPDVPLASALAAEARTGVRAMLVALLARLRGPVQLPECLRIVGYLRRLGVFSEHELRLTFLRCRDAWLATCVAELEAGAPYEYAKRLTDTHRVHLFDAVMQFRAIFADDTSAADATLLLPAAGGGAGTGGGVGDGGAGGSLVYAWATHRMCTYLEALSATLPRLSEGATLASVLEHCTYCGASLGRVGLDFRGLLQPMFAACVETLVTRALAAAVDGLEGALAAHRWAAALPASPGAAGAAVLPSAPSLPGGDDDFAPPISLMEHPPVAAFVNALLAALNELRHCALPSLRAPLAAALHNALAGAAGAVVRYHSTRTPPLTDVQAAQLGALGSALADVAAPYAAACFGRIYPGAAHAVDASGAAAPMRPLLARLRQRAQPPSNGTAGDAADEELAE